MIELRDLIVGGDGFSVGPLDLRVEDGEYVTLVGPTGAGKTLVLETIAGLRRPLGGEVWLDGRRADTLPPEQRGIGVVYQDSLLFPHLNVRDNIAFGLGAGSLPAALIGRRPAAAPTRGDARRLASEAAARLGAGHLLARRPATLSGGERQCVALARALVTRPRALLLDEPLSAVDERTREFLQAVLHRAHADDGAAVIHVTHSLAEAAALGDRCAVLGEGRLQQVAPMSEVLRRPATAFVARFGGARNVIPGVARPVAGEAEFATTTDFAGSTLCRVDLEAGPTVLASACRPGPVMAVVRADEVEVHPGTKPMAATGTEPMGATGAEPIDASGAETTVMNRVQATVVEVVDQGAATLIVTALAPASAGDAASPGVAAATRFYALVAGPRRRRPVLTIGQSVTVSFSAAAVHLVPL